MNSPVNKKATCIAQELSSTKDFIESVHRGTIILEKDIRSSQPTNSSYECVWHKMEKSAHHKFFSRVIYMQS